MTADAPGEDASAGAGEAVPDTVRLPRWAAFLVLSWGALLALLGAARAASAWPPWLLLALLVGLSVPIFFFGSWRASLRRAHELRLFRDGGRLRHLLGRPVLRTVVWLAAAPMLALAVFVSAAAANRPTIVAFMVPPALCLVFLLCDRVLRAEVAAPHRRAMAIRTAVLLAPVLLVVADFAVTLLWGDIPHYATLADAVRANISTEAARSVVLDELLRLAAYVNAMEAFALGRVGDWGGVLRAVAWVGFAALNLAFYAGLARAVAILLLPRSELRRALLPASDAPVPRRLAAVEAAITSALATILVVFILIPGLAAAEAWLSANRPSIYAETMVERIDDQIVRPGTIDILDKLRRETVKGLGVDQAALSQAANAGFDAMERNVDAFLDAYYSLPAEYLRIAALLMGETDLEQRLTDDLAQYLMADAPFGDYEARLKAALGSADRVRAIYETAVNDVLRIMALDLPADARLRVVASAPRSGLALPKPDVEVTTPGSRGVTSAAAGGIVAALVVKKIAAKGTLKLAAKAVAKVVASKAAGASGGAGAGALAGGAIGSAVPVIGTAVGAAVGGVIGGLAVGVGVDYLILKLEEAWSREEFRQQLLAAIEEQRAAFLNGLGR